MSDVVTASDVARLLGRAAFGARAADFDQWVGGSYTALVDSLFPPLPADRRPPAPDDPERLTYDNATTNTGALGTAMSVWWMERLRSTLFPFEERMTLFWHDHFATAHISPPNVVDMARQNQTLRVNCLGDFRAFCFAMTIDPAMLLWLSGYRSHKNGVNENYARELFELFTNGVIPQLYTEGDVREAAKALTGWGLDAQRRAKYDDTRHSRGTKSVCGRTIGGYPAADARNATEYQEVVDAALSLPTAAPFVAYKLVLNFGYVPTTRNLLANPTEDPLVAKVAAALSPAWDVRAAVRAMFLADEWRTTMVPLVRSPIETCVHAARLLGVSLDQTKTYGTPPKTSPINEFVDATSRAGQKLFYPPGVEGWPYGEAWLAQPTNLGRYEILNTVFKWWKLQNVNTRVALPPSSDVDGWVRFMGLSTISANTRAQLQSYLAAPGTTVEIDKQGGVFKLLGSSPDWQVL